MERPESKFNYSLEFFSVDPESETNNKTDQAMILTNIDFDDLYPDENEDEDDQDDREEENADSEFVGVRFLRNGTIIADSLGHEIMVSLTPPSATSGQELFPSQLESINDASVKQVLSFVARMAWQAGLVQSKQAILDQAASTQSDPPAPKSDLKSAISGEETERGWFSRLLTHGND